MTEHPTHESGKDALERVLRALDGSEFTADEFPALDDARAAREYVERLEKENAELHRAVAEMTTNA